MKLLHVVFGASLLITLMMTTVLADTVKLQYDGDIHSYNNRDINIYIDGEHVDYDGMFPVIIDGRTLVPVREVLSNSGIGAEVIWDQDQQQVTVKGEDLTIELWINQSVALINGNPLMMDSKAKLIGFEGAESAKTMVPLRFITEALGYEVTWDQETQSIDLMSDQGTIDGQGTEVNIDQLQGGVSFFTLDEDDKAMHFKPYADEVANIPTSLSLVVYYSYHDRFAIFSKEAMSDISYGTQNNQLLIKIKNATIDKLSDLIALTDNPYVSQVLFKQPSLEPMTAEIIFDMKEGIVPTKVDINPNRDEINVVFGGDGLEKIEGGTYDQGTYIDVVGDVEDAQAYRLDGPDRIVFDLENTVNAFGDRQFSDLSNPWVESVKVGQYNPTTTRIVVETKGLQPYQMVTTARGQVRLLIGEAADELSEAQWFDANYTKIAVLEGGDHLDLEATYMDYDYIMKEANLDLSRINLPKNAALLEVNEVAIKAFELKENKQLTLTSDHVYEYVLKAEDEGLVIYGARPRALHSKIVVIDGGHGGLKPGASHNGLIEKNLNLSLTTYMSQMMDQYPDTAFYFTRDKDVDISFEDRCELANDLKADLFLSVHNNAMDVTHYPKQIEVRGLEVLVKDTKEQSSKEKAIAEAFMAGMASMVPDYETRKIKVNNELYVLNNTYMPSVLIEYGYISNPLDGAFLSDEENLKRLSEASMVVIDQVLHE